MKQRWFEAFDRNPDQAVTDLFTGRAGVGADMRLDVPELLQQWFPESMADDRRRLDEALLGWLRTMQYGYRSVVERIGFTVYGKRVGDALIALQLLDLPQARDAIREDLAAWLRWLSPLRLAPERDPALECYGLLTQGQLDLGHIAMWLRLAADRRPEYLTVALAGMRRLPNEGDARQNQVLMLQALLRHAVVRFHEVNGAHRFFNRGFAAVRGLFPRAPNHWNGVLDDALYGFGQGKSPVAVDLAARLREKVTKTPPASPRRLPVPDAEWQTLERDIDNRKESADQLARRLFAILEHNHRYALDTGDSYAFVRALGNLGNRLLEHYEPSTDDMKRLGAMVERGLAWEPQNPYCWTLWAKWFEAQGTDEAQEAILREAVRLFPRNVVVQVDLAGLLATRGEDWRAEAEHYLDRAIDQDPYNEHALFIKAHVLVRRGQHHLAHETLAGILERNPNDDRAREAMKRFQEGVNTGVGADREPNSSIEWQAAGTDASQIEPVALREVLRRGVLASEFSRARIAGHMAGQTSRIKQESRMGDPLAGFYSQWLRLPDTPLCPPHAWAWNACLHWQKSAADKEWEQLAKRFPEAAPETRFLRMLAGSASSNGSIPQYRDFGSVPARPIDAIVRDGQAMLAATDLDERDRDELACSLMACAAVDTPEFSPTMV